MTDEEEWRPVVGWEGVYEVSDQGRVRRVKAGPGAQVGRTLKPNTSSRYLQVVLSREGVTRTQYVHRLVCAAFHGPPPFEGAHVLHGDDNPRNNHVSNLRWGTVSENMYDSVRNGGYRNQNTDKTHCIRGHPLPVDRKCRECKRLAQAERAIRGIPQGDPRHGTLTGYTFWSCRCDLCKEAQRIYDFNRNRSR